MIAARLHARRPPHDLAPFGRGMLAALLLITLPAADAATYKWVDEQGQVHYSDSPPQGVAYEVVAAPAVPSAVPPPRAATQAPPPPRPAPAPPGATPARSAAESAATDRTCVDALYQITLLNQQRPVFIQAASGSRRYLDDADRPAELERLQRTRDESCSDDPGTRNSQEQRAGELMVALSRRCAEARDKLASYEDPATHTPDDQIERQRAFVEQYCRGGERTDLWLGDWTRVGR